MNNELKILPINVAGATFVIQWALCLIFWITSHLMQNKFEEAKNLPRNLEVEENFLNQSKNFSFPILFTAMLPVAFLIISEDFFKLWQPIFGGINIPTITSSLAITFVFILDTIMVMVLISQTGGAKNSPYTAALFTIPTLGIFLHLPSTNFISLAIFTAIGYLLLNKIHYQVPKRSNHAMIFMNIACLTLSVITGFITRPIPIDKL